MQCIICNTFNQLFIVSSLTNASVVMTLEVMAKTMTRNGVTWTVLVIAARTVVVYGGMLFTSSEVVASCYRMYLDSVPFLIFSTLLLILLW